MILVSDDAGSLRGCARSVEALAGAIPRRGSTTTGRRRAAPRSARGRRQGGQPELGAGASRRVAPDAELIETRTPTTWWGTPLPSPLRGHLCATAGPPTSRPSRRRASPPATRSTTSSRFLPRRHAGPPRRQRGLPVRVGPGLAPRRADDIGGFPTWNLVEDLQSGVEALRRGWRGAYLPIRRRGRPARAGGPARTSTSSAGPGRSTRCGCWSGATCGGLNLRQRLQFAELGLFYLQSFATLVFVACPAIGFAAGVYPLDDRLRRLRAPFLAVRRRDRALLRCRWLSASLRAGVAGAGRSGPVWLRST